MKKLITLLCCLLITSASFAAIRRVDVNVVGGANNGTSWANAYNNLTVALGAAVSGDQIWVADGTYIPGANPADGFLIPSGVSVYGGFAGGEATLAARNVATNIAILSGNNVCNHVVGFNNVTAATRLDGFTISGASGGGIGGGIYNYGGGTNVTIENCIIKNNSAGQGAGMCNDGTSTASNPTVKGCTFTLNSAFQGGGVFNYGPSGNVGGTYTNCVFDNNGTSQGTALFNAVKKGTSTLSFTNCEFKNHSANYNYAVDNYGEEATTKLSFVTCTFTNNSGGAIFNNNYNSTNNNTLTVTNCTFTQNGGTGSYSPYGSAIGIYAQKGKCTPTVSGCTFSKNGGSAVYNDGSQGGQCSGSYTNCQFIENIGTALYNYGNYGKSNQTISNCTFSKNGATYGYAALYNHGDNGEAVSVVSNCIFSENKSGSLYNYRNFKGTARPTFTNCTFSKDAGGSYSGAVYNNGNGDYCPAFTDCKFLDNGGGEGAAVYNYFDAYSPNAASSKNNTTFLRCTFTGNSSSGSNGGGAVYNNFSGIVSVSFTDCVMKNNKATGSSGNGGAMVNYVNSSATGSLTVTNCNFDENEASNIGGGVFNNGASISMAYTNCTFNKNKLTSSYGYSGGGGVYNFKSNGNEAVSYTDCQFNENESNAYGGGIVNNGGYNGGSYNVQYLRCTINNNKTTGNSSYSNYGGGICNFSMGDYPIMTSCSISGNMATYVQSSVTKYADGGGIYNNRSYGTLTNCTINNNKGRSGGGLYNISGFDGSKETKLVNCNVRGNEAIADGPGDYAGGDGGGIGNHDSKMTLLNCLIAGNSANHQAGGVLSAYNSSSRTSIINCTITGNKAPFAGGIFYNTTPTNIKNSIVWGNSTQIEGYHDENLSINHSLIQGLNPAGTGNLDGTLASNDPIFINPENFSSAPTLLGDYHVPPCSPVINLGDGAANSTTTDLEGSNRKFGIIDLGVYEYQGATVGKPTLYTVTGGGTACGNNGITVSLSGSQVGVSYQLKKNNDNLGSPKAGTGAAISFGTQLGGVYTVIANSGGCILPMNGSATIITGQVSGGGVQGGNVICVGGTIAFTANAGLSSYSWSRLANKFSSTQQNPVIPSAKLTDAGAYLLTARGTDGCTSSAMVLVLVTNPGINAAFTVSPSKIVSGSPVTLSATSATGTYSWTGPSGNLGSSRTVTINPFNSSKNGTYRLTLTNGSCKGYTEQAISVPDATRLASGEDEDMLMEIKAYPNPTSKTLTVEVTLKEPSALKLQLFNAIGQAMSNWDLSEETTTHRTQIDMSVYHEGLYLIQAESKDGKQIKRVMKIE
jgi:hypothetical protein